MKKYFALCVALLGFTVLFAQTAKTGDAGNKVYTIAQVMPKFPGDINKYLADHIVYPADAKANMVAGTIYVTFVVEKDGSISGVQVLKGLQGGITLEKEVMSVISSMPKWAPGQQNGQAVRVQYTVPVKCTP